VVVHTALTAVGSREINGQRLISYSTLRNAAVIGLRDESRVAGLASPLCTSGYHGEGSTASFGSSSAGGRVRLLRGKLVLLRELEALRREHLSQLEQAAIWVLLPVIS